MLDIFCAIFFPDIISWEFQSGYLEMDLETYSSEYMQLEVWSLD